MKVLAIGPDGNPITGQYMAFNSFVRHSNIQLNVVTFGGGESLFKKLKSNITFIFSFIIQLIKNRPNVIYFTSVRSMQGFLRDFLIINIGKLFKAKVVNHLHGADFNLFFDNAPSYIKPIIDWTYRKIDCSIVLSELMKDQYKRYEKSMDIAAIPNCYDNSINYVQVDKKHKVLRLLYLSNLMRSKGIIELLDAVSTLKDKGVNIELKVAGNFLSDHLKKATELEQEFHAKNKGYAEYLGPVRGTDKLDLLAWADCLVLPTYYPTEAQPICVIEAMAAGCYIISTNHNYMPDLIKPKNGELVTPQSVDELMLAIERISKKEELLNQVKIYNSQYAKNNFSLSSYVNRIDSIIFNLIK